MRCTTRRRERSADPECETVVCGAPAACGGANRAGGHLVKLSHPNVVEWPEVLRREAIPSVAVRARAIVVELLHASEAE